MRVFSLCFMPVIGLMCILFPIGASPHGMTPDVQAAATIALVQKCKDDQPQVAKDIDASFRNWEARNHRYVEAFHIYGEGSNKEVLRAIRQSYDENGPATYTNCRDFVKALLRGESDVVINGPSRGVEPEVQAAVVIVSVQKCKDDQPQVALEIDVSFEKWEDRNRQYVTALHRDGEGKYKEGIQAFRKSYDAGGRATEPYCKALIQRLEGAGMNVVE